MEKRRTMTMEELLALPTVVPLKVAASALGISHGEAYRQAAADEFPCPVKRRGRALLVARPDLFRELGLDPAMVRDPQARAS